MSRCGLIALTTIALLSPALAQKGDVTRGQRDFQACAPCHSLEPDRNMTGPSLANLWGRRTIELRPLFRCSQIVGNYLGRPRARRMVDRSAAVPNNEMPFEGINDARVRADMLAFLKDATKPGATPERTAQAQMKGMGGMMGGGGRDPNLKGLEPSKRVQAITYCRDTYRVTTADGKTRAFWERNLRFMTDSGKEGPESGAPAIMPAGMMGDRAAVIFAAPEEINKLIEARC